MEKNEKKSAVNLFLFDGLDRDTVDSIFSEIDFKIENYSKGDMILSPSLPPKGIGFILEGECRVSRHRGDAEPIQLNTLPRYSAFGILAVFSDSGEFPTEIIAARPTKILFISKEDMIYLVRRYPDIAMNVISFMADRISFLNSKISTFSEKSTLQKLVNYLLAKYRKLGNTITCARTDISTEIGVGRASLYRDLSSLEAEGIIKVETKKIFIINPEGLERKNL